MVQLQRSQYIPTLQEYNNSRLIATDVLSGQEYRRKLRRDKRHPEKISFKGYK
jgi:ATP sulfurylase